MNVVVLVGNLATEVELRELGPEKKLAKFLLAVNRPGEGADFAWVTVWDRQAELSAEYLRKGSPVGIDGRLRSRTWEEDGKRRDAIEIVANRVEFLGSRQAQDSPFERAPAAA